jgi:hypothetical protein
VSDVDRELEALRADVRRKLAETPPPAIVEAPPRSFTAEVESDRDDESPPRSATRAFVRKVVVGTIALVALYIVWVNALGPMVKLGLTLAVAVALALLMYRLFGGRRGRDDDGDDD